jgi:hypothetical protein
MRLLGPQTCSPRELEVPNTGGCVVPEPASTGLVGIWCADPLQREYFMSPKTDGCIPLPSRAGNLAEEKTRVALLLPARRCIFSLAASTRRRAASTACFSFFTLVWKIHTQARQCTKKNHTMAVAIHKTSKGMWHGLLVLM